MEYNYFLALFTTFCFSQNEKKAIILDKDDKQAIEFVNIYNRKILPRVMKMVSFLLIPL